MSASDDPSASAPAPDPDALTGKPCAVCAKPAVNAYRPFCSRRCADVDLGRWLSGAYSVPAAPDFDEDGDEDELSPDRARDL
jgi:endogenous inhibitor of DNA gyrase (YacG/DUF329 family)